jgi:hypothetical protein
MRIENKEPHRTYRDFWDWVFKDGHIIFLAALLIGYFYYLLNTTEI